MILERSVRSVTPGSAENGASNPRLSTHSDGVQYSQRRLINVYNIL